MNNSSISIQDRTKQFAIRVVKSYTEIKRNCHFDDAVSILAKQFLRSGTSIGANCKEAISAQSKKDFLSKYEIALKEAQETEYWIEIMIETALVPKEKFVLMLDENSQIIRILSASTRKLKE
jgi:four helix bundle protein